MMECDRASPQAAGGEGASARAGTASHRDQHRDRDRHQDQQHHSLPAPQPGRHLGKPLSSHCSTQHLGNGRRLSSVGCGHCAGTCPARRGSLSVLLSPADKPFRTSSLRLRCHFSPGLSTPQWEAQKGIKHCKAPRINAAGDPPAQRRAPHRPPLCFSFSHLLQKHPDAAKSLLATTKKGVKMSNCTCVCRGLEQMALDKQ